MRRFLFLLVALCLAPVAVPVTARAQATPPDSAALDSLRGDLVRVRAFMRASATEATKAIDRLDSLRARRAAPAPDTAPATPSAPPADTTPPPIVADTAPAAVDSGPALPELPRVTVDVTMPASTRTLRVPAGADLQAALDSARGGDEIVLDAGATYVGMFVLRSRADSGWVVVRTVGTLPPVGARITPAAAPQLARLVSPYATSPVLRTAAGAHGWRLVGLEITADSAATQAGTLVALGDAGPDQRTVASVPRDLVLDRVYVHGTPTLNFQRCIGLNSGATAIVDSWISECHGKGMDSQAIGGWNGTGPYRIENNRLEAAGENVMFGGATLRIEGVVPSDITIRRNHVVKPPEWKGVWSVKNLIELKVGRRVLIEGNVFENVWVDAQTGFALLFKSTDQYGTSPWAETSDVTVRLNRIDNAVHGISLAGNPESHPTIPAHRVLIEQNVLDRIGTGDFTASGGGRLFMVNELADLTIRHNTAASKHDAVLFTGPASPRFTLTANLFGRTGYPIIGDGHGTGTAALDYYSAGTWTVAGNVIPGAPSKTYPAGNWYPSWTSTPTVDALLSAAAALTTLPADVGADLAAVQAATAGVVVTP